MPQTIAIEKVAGKIVSAVSRGRPQSHWRLRCAACVCVGSLLPASLIATSVVSAAQSGTPSADQTTAESDAGKMAAEQLARATLSKQLNIPAIDMNILSSESATWLDSSLGCGQRGSMAAQVLTPGYEFLLATPQGNYRVHVAREHAVICGAATKWSNPHGVAAPLKNLDQKIAEARADLAKKLHAPLNQIRTATITRAEWPDSSMACKIFGEQIEPHKIQGYRIALRYAGRIYTYHTDLIRVRVCPPIETQ